jgi:hypothetical protein
MRKIRGSALIIALAVLGVLVIGAGIAFASYVSYFNYGNRSEKALTALYENGKNINGQYTIKVREMIQLPGMHADKLGELMTKAIEARYGEDGSKAVMQWIQEQNPNLDPQLYARVQQTIEAGRNDFTTHQTMLLDRKAAYETALGGFWSGMWLRFAGYPKIDLDEIKIVVATDTAEKFERGTEAPLDLRQPDKK